MFLSNVLNPIGDQQPDLPSMKCDSLPMSIVIPSSSTRERSQFISGHIDGTIRLYTARPTHEWWKPELYDEGDVDYYEEDEDDGDVSEEDVVADDAFELSWSIKQSALPVRSIDLFPRNKNLLACATREGAIGIIDTETHQSVLTYSDHQCGYSTLKTWDDNMIICGDEEGCCVGLDLRCGTIPAFSKQIPQTNTTNTSRSKSQQNNNNNNNTKKTLTSSQPKPTTLLPTLTSNQYSITKRWTADDFGDYITSMTLSQKHSQAIFGSADKHVSSYDLRNGKYLDAGKNFDEVNSVALLKDDELILTGSDNGPLSTFALNNMEYMKDRYLFQQKSVDFILSLDDDTVLTGTEDGIVRLLTINPTRIIGVVAVHKSWLTAIATQRGKLAQDDFVWANDIVCCASADNVVRFWDIQDMQIVRQNLTKEQKKAKDKKRELEWNDSGKKKNRTKGASKQSQGQSNKNNNSDDLDDSDDDSDDDDIQHNKAKKHVIQQHPNKRQKTTQPQHADDDSDDYDYDNNDDSDSDDYGDLSDDGFDLNADETFLAFQKMAEEYEVKDFHDNQERLRKKYGVEFLQPSVNNVGDNDDDDDQQIVGNNSTNVDDNGSDTSDFDWDNPPTDSDEDDYDEDDDEDDTGIDYDTLDKLSPEEQDTMLQQLLSELEHTKNDGDNDDDSDDDNNTDDEHQNIINSQQQGLNHKSKTLTQKSKNSPSAQNVQVSTKTATISTIKSNMNDKANNKSHKEPPTKQPTTKTTKASDKKPLLPPPGPHIVPTILDATLFDHQKFRHAHNHKLADANRSGFYSDKNKKRKEIQLSNQDQPKAINGLTQLPNIQHQLPKSRKLKHGTSNFFNGLQ